MRILITGGAGFQGGHLADRWVRAGHDITILNTYSSQAERNISAVAGDVRTVWGSVTDKEIVDKTVRGHDVVVHLAALINVDDSLEGPRSFVDVNVGGTVNVLEAARRESCRVIYASSCEVYGHSEKSPVAEDAEIRPHSPYAASKAGADRLCFAYNKSYGLDLTIMRPCNVYGPHQKSGRGGAVIPIFAGLAAEGKPLRVFGDGSQQREYINVLDLVSAYDLVLRRNDLTGAVLNVGTGETPSINDIATFISEKTGATISHEPSRRGEVRGFSLNSSRIKELGFAPEIAFWEGVETYLDANGSTK